MALLKAESLTKIYGEGDAEVRAVDQVDLEIDRGEVLLIMGPSGSGKTTLLFMLGGLLRPTEGRLIVGGREITSLSEKELAGIRLRNFGFIFQDFNLFSALTALENVEVSLNLAGVRGEPARERSLKLLKLMSLEARADFLPEQLSGGEKQRISISRALANFPPLILGDEPTANLDSHAGRKVANILRALARTGRRSVIIVSHDARIVDIADRVLLMEDGHLSEPDGMKGDVSVASIAESQDTL